MEDEKLALHDWEGQNIFTKAKHETIAQYVTETVMSMRWFLVGKIIQELKALYNLIIQIIQSFYRWWWITQN